MRYFFVLVLLLLPMSSAAQVAAVTEIVSSKVKVFERHDGGETIAVVPRDDIVLPAAQLSHPSEYGLIQVELRLKDSSKPAIVGWIMRRSVEVDTKLKIDVISDCAKSLSSGSSVARGTRGLGGC